MIFSGLSGFPITPLRDSEVDTNVLDEIIHSLDKSGLDSIGVLGSTGSFAYLSSAQKKQVFEHWSQATTPWIAGVSATSTKEAIEYCRIAKQCGAAGVIANAFAYLPLSESELIRYFLSIADASELPVCVYDNPVTTGQKLSQSLIEKLSAHPNIKAAKVFAQPENQAQHDTLSRLALDIGYAVDANACEAIIAGGCAWYSTLAGTAPELLVPVMTAIKNNDISKARELNAQNLAIYELMRKNSGYKVVHAIASLKGWHCELPPPLIQSSTNEVKKLFSLETDENGCKRLKHLQT